MKKISILVLVLIISGPSYADQPKKVLCELEGNYSITYEDFRRNYFNEAVEIAKNVAVTTTQSIFFLNRAKQTLNKDAWDKNKIEVTQYWAIDEFSDDLLKLDYVIEPGSVWITQSDWRKEKKETGLLVTHFLDNGAMHPNYPDYKVDVYQLSNEINWFTGKASIKGDIWLKRIDGKKGKDPKIEILAKGKCEKQKRKF
ncbi:MAG: hypothetical protein EVA52_01045 [Gammaproteobacteria bacterium]|jgi:hypothetical protein|nr:MAG: hypothetical protein EVA52_01045 [Gammaproteobacteria bacterium]